MSSIITLISKFMKKSWLPTSLLVMYSLTIVLLILLDYFNIEGFPLLNTEGFYFVYTWKGRLFLLFFLWLFVLEFLNLNKSSDGIKSLPISNFRIVAALLCAAIPLVYVLCVNFFGGSQAVIAFGDALRGDYWRQVSTSPDLILNVEWVIVFEYLLFTFSFLMTILLAYGKDGLKNYSITLGLIGGITAAYTIDVFLPYGAFRPFQIMVLPIISLAAGVLGLLGYRLSLSYLSSTPKNINPVPEIQPYEYLPANVPAPAFGDTVNIDWSFAGIHSLFLYALLVLLLFKKSNISMFRKLIYFVVGALGTCIFNVLRVVTYFVILYDTYDASGMSAAQNFHAVYGELFSVIWILLYLLLIVYIEKSRLIDRTKTKLYDLLYSLKLLKKQAPENDLNKTVPL